MALAGGEVVGAAELDSAVVLPVPDAPLTTMPRRAETWCRLSWISSLLVPTTFRMTGVFTSGRPMW